MIQDITTALERDRQAGFLVECDFDGYKLYFATRSVALADRKFSGTIINQPAVRTAFSISAMRSADTTIAIQVSNADRLQDLERTRYLDRGTASIYLWSPSLSWSDISPYPVFKGSFRKAYHDKFTYAFDIVDFANTTGKTISSLSAISGSPADNIMALLTVYTSLNIGDIDDAGLGTMQSTLGTLKFSTAVDDPANAFDIIDRILFECACGRLTNNGKVGVVVYDPNAPATHRLGQQDILGETVKIAPTAQELVTNDVLVQYNQSGGSWGNTLTLDWTNDKICKQSRNDYGPRPQYTLQLADVADAATATACVRRHLAWKAFRHDTVECLVPHCVGFPMFPGALAELTISEGPGEWQAEKFMLLERMINLDHIKQKWWKVAV